MKELYAKLYNVMIEGEALAKDMTVGEGKNAYKAVSERELLNKVKPLFKKYKLIVFPISGAAKETVLTYDTEYKGEKTTKLRAVTELSVTYRIVDVESGQSIDIVGFGNGADPQDKGAGKAFTYSYKAALQKTFMLFSGDDTDNTHSDDLDGETVDRDSVKQELVKAFLGLKKPLGEEGAFAKLKTTKDEMNNLAKSGSVGEMQEMLNLIKKVGASL